MIYFVLILVFLGGANCAWAIIHRDFRWAAVFFTLTLLLILAIGDGLAK